MYSDRARSKRLIVNIVGAMAGRAITLLAPLIVMPAMLEYLGSSSFGIWMIAVSLTSMAMFADLGVGNGLLTRLSAAHGRGDFVAGRVDIASAYAILTAVAVLASIVVGIVLLTWANIAESLTASSFSINSLAIIGASFVCFFAGLPAGVIQRVMYARQQVLLSNLWQVAGAFLSVVACFTGIAAGWPAWAVVTLYGLSPVLVAVVAAGHYFFLHSDLRPRITDCRWEHARALLLLGGRFLSLAILTSISLNIDNVLIGTFRGPEAVTDFAVPAKIGSFLGLIITTIFLPLWGANGEALAKGDRAWVWKNSVRMSAIGGATITVMAILLFLASDWIISVWMGRIFPGQQSVLAALGAFSVVMALTSPMNMVLNALGEVRVQIQAWSGFFALTLLTKALFVRDGGLWMLPAISAFTYAFVVLPVITRAARRRLRNE